MRRISILSALILVILAASGCARTEKVRAYEEITETPYISMGTLEVKEKANFVTTGGTLWTGAEALTLTMIDSPTRGEHYKKIIRDKLAHIAKRRYGAHAVINVKYWPDPESSRFPEGYIYGRGEMIRYLSFPPENAVPQASA